MFDGVMKLLVKGYGPGAGSAVREKSGKAAGAVGIATNLLLFAIKMAAGLLSGSGVDTLICGGIGGGARAALAQAGIQLYGGVSGDADQAVADLLSGKLAYDPAAECRHHDEHHGHDCGGHHDHHCGGHGHACGEH